MRIITGSARGRKLKSLGGEGVRPTSDRVKEALFSIVQFQIEGRRILDLFAGNGQLGLEALSRGAEHAVFVDSSSKALAVVRENIEVCGFSDKSRTVHSDAAAYLARCREKFDVAFLDPPYGSNMLEKTLPMLAPRMNPGGTILCESDAKKELPEAAGDFIRDRIYRYGKIAVTRYQKPLD
ncbi:MAG: 16S rRNA (guanine(966)-N(2))-methyltransferase RsmD [Oscillospiraceae bacterium]|nr:16S rRNA (guanine(966)-N(2))-methyltransferase RsmD [Oscillospiraceae bacterium]